MLQICDQAHETLDEAERQHKIVLDIGPITADTLITQCIEQIDEIRTLIQKADETFDKAIKAGAYYDLRGSADDGMADCDNLNRRLEDEEARLVRLLTRWSLRAGPFYIHRPHRCRFCFSRSRCPHFCLLTMRISCIWQYEENFHFRQPLKVFASKF